MPDDLDRAQGINEQLQADALAAHFRRVRRLPAATFEATACVDCDEPIPEKRLQASPGCIRCVDCQRDFEQRGRRG
ncbi:MAG: TraR/DksA family transcriptional regulator [Desulfuromonadales bacterium]|nr:TraR/DksA family transcriptional regulator [Desulfuromonadales bacterium]